MRVQRVWRVCGQRASGKVAARCLDAWCDQGRAERLYRRVQGNVARLAAVYYAYAPVSAHARRQSDQSTIWLRQEAHNKAYLATNW
jgi:hypothetical protein